MCAAKCSKCGRRNRALTAVSSGCATPPSTRTTKPFKSSLPIFWCRAGPVPQANNLIEKGLRDAYSGGRRGRARRLFRRQAQGHRPRRYVFGAAAPRRTTGQDRACHPQPPRRRQYPAASDNSGGEPARAVRSHPVELQSLRPAIGNGFVCACGRRGHGDIAALERHETHGSPCRAVRRRRDAGRSMRHLGNARPARSCPPLNDLHFVSYGEQDGSKSARATAIAAAFSGARFESQLSTTIMQEMWEKWAIIAAVAGITCVLRGAVGDIMAADAGQLPVDLYAECCAIAAANGFAPGERARKRSIGMLTAPGSTFAASMLRDIERHAPIEADHVVGDLLQRGGKNPNAYPLLQVAYAHLRTYEARRQREAAAAS